MGSELILKNIGHVFEHFPELPVLIRTPVIPGFNHLQMSIGTWAADGLLGRFLLPHRPGAEEGIRDW